MNPALKPYQIDGVLSAAAICIQRSRTTNYLAPNRQDKDIHRAIEYLKLALGED